MLGQCHATLGVFCSSSLPAAQGFRDFSHPNPKWSNKSSLFRRLKWPLHGWCRGAICGGSNAGAVLCSFTAGNLLNILDQKILLFPSSKSLPISFHR